MRFKKGFVFLCSIIFTMIVLAGCNSESASGTDSGEDATSDETPTITIMTKLHTAEVPSDKIKELVEEKTGVNLEIEWVPDNNYADKLSTAFATGTFPMAVTMGSDQVGEFTEAIRDGQFWEIGPYLDEFENLSKLNEEKLNNTKVDGKIYSLYQGRPFSRQGMIYRKDWADNLGLSAPETVEEFFDMAKAFSENDPDGNGKDDTIGVTDRGDLEYGLFKTLASWFGTPNNWGEKDGELLPEFMFDEYMETMNFVKELRENGYMNQDFPVTSKEDQQAMFKNGTAGIYVGAMVDVLNMYTDAIELNPDLEYDVHNYVAGPSGEFTVWANPGYNNEILFPKTAIKDEEQLKQVLAFYDKMMTPELANLVQWGIEGEHYEVVDGFAEISDDQAKIEREVFTYNMLGIGEPETNGRYESLHGYDVRQKAEELIKENDEHLIHDPTVQLESDTFIRDGERLQEIINDATYNYMLGEIDEDGFYREVEKWKEQGGDQIIEEFNAVK